ncbi:MAG: SDR family NAD(P)-dependent oxidoreductase [Bdellovibrionales bacterium]|nr:SDR family NAD(P)-dependent oxidoreductase [Bdellovibrionales bacterium]
MTTNKPLVLLTGASTGLGLALAKELIEDGNYRLVLTARAKSLKCFSAAGIFESDEIYLRPLDVTSKEERIAVISECEATLGGLDVLINNAGIAMRSVVEDASADDRIGLLEINYIGPMRLAALALPGMRKRRNGRIINISSAAGLIGMPTMACYCGSKFALEGGAESLWYDVKPWNIHVTLIIPGFMRSDSFQNTQTTKWSRAAIASGQKDPYYHHYRNMEKLISWTMKRTLASPESVARKIVRVIKQKNPSLRVPVTADAWFLFLFRRFLPRAIYHWVMFRALPASDRWGEISSERSVPPINSTTNNISIKYD